MRDEVAPALRPDFFGQLAATDPHRGRARRLFERGQVVAVNGNQADLLLAYDAAGNPLELKHVPVVSGYVPRLGDWVSIQYEAGHSGAPWVSGPSMAADDPQDSAGIGVFSVSDTEPADPQRSMVYFDGSSATWRGWDGSDWVDFSAKLHNNLPDLQGGEAGAYYHFAADEHASLQDLHDGSGMASAWVRRLRFKSIDAAGTQRTALFEKDGDHYWAINASYDEQAGVWSRIDTTKYAYLIELRSNNSIPSEPIGGVVWWRAIPGENPIGDYTAVGGWELGFMMTEHRNYVMGGTNLEMDGSGTPPYGRLTQIGSDDASGTVVTAIQRNSWYEGSGQWGRDSHDKNSAIIGFDADANVFVWWYPDSAEGNAPWATSAWQARAKFNLGGSTRGRFDVCRSSSETNIPSGSFMAKHVTSADMVDGFGASYLLAIQDSAGVENIIGALDAVRDGADDTGKLSIRLASGGSLAERMSLTAGGLLSVADISASSTGSFGGDLTVGGVLSASQLGSSGTLGLLTAANADRSVYLYDSLYPDGNPSNGLYIWTYSRFSGGPQTGTTWSAVITDTLRYDDGDVHTGAHITAYIGGVVHGDFTGTLPNWYALYVDPLPAPGGGTITNNYGVYIDTPAGATNNWALYIAGGAFCGEYQTQTGGWANPSGPTSNGRIVTVYNSTQAQHRLYAYSNGGWHYVALI